MATDTEIIESVLEGEVDRYAELVNRYQSAAWQVAFGLVGNWEDAKDLSQNGFVKAYQHLRAFRREARFSTWLYRIVVNECKDFLKRRGRIPQVVAWLPDPEADGFVLFDVEDPARHAGQVALDHELARHLSVAVRALPLQQRTAFVLHHLQGLSIEEAAGVMKCRIGTVKAHLFRACERLRERLAPEIGGGSEQ